MDGRFKVARHFARPNPALHPGDTSLYFAALQQKDLQSLAQFI
jgi:hypothetical protein